MLPPMASFDDLQRTFFDGLYTNRVSVGVAFTVVLAVAFVVAWRAGWFRAARRHPVRASALLVVALAVGVPVGYYLASPIWVRTVLLEPDPVAIDTVARPVPTPTESLGSTAPSAATPSQSPVATAPSTPAPTPFAPRRIAAGRFTGTDDFHFGRGTATIVETKPGTYVLRLADFSVRNGPDLYVYLSPDAGDYTKGALEVGRLKATDGAFGYELPAGTDPADFASAIIWCKQFAHLFAVASLAAT